MIPYQQYTVHNLRVFKNWFIAAVTLTTKRFVVRSKYGHVFGLLQDVVHSGLLCLIGERPESQQPDPVSERPDGVRNEQLVYDVDHSVGSDDVHLGAGDLVDEQAIPMVTGQVQSLTLEGLDLGLTQDGRRTDTTVDDVVVEKTLF